MSEEAYESIEVLRATAEDLYYSADLTAEEYEDFAQRLDVITDRITELEFDLRNRTAEADALRESVDRLGVQRAELRIALDERDELRLLAEMERDEARAQLERQEAALRQWEKSYPCPCGAWFDDLSQRPHALGCPVDAALSTPPNQKADSFTYEQELAERRHDD